MLPDVRELRDATLALRVEEYPSRSVPPGAVSVASAEVAVQGDGRCVEVDTVLVLRMHESSPMSLAALAERVATALARQGHDPWPDDPGAARDLSWRVLALAAQTAGTADRRWENLQDLLATLSDARIESWAVLPMAETDARHHELGDFVYGVVDAQKLRALCQRVGSDFYERYRDRVVNNRAVRRCPRPIKCLDPDGFENRNQAPSAMDRFYRLTESYYGMLTHLDRASFLADLRSQQVPFAAAGLGFIDGPLLNSLVHWITIISRDQRGRGWVRPDLWKPTVRIPSPNALRKLMQEIERSLRLEDWGQRALDDAIATYSDYLVRARRAEDEGRLDEALLYTVFGLDYLLGGASGRELAKLLAARVSVLTHATIDMDIHRVRSFVKDCYAIRSAYAHRGQQSSMNALNGLSLRERCELLARVARAVLGSAYIVRRRSWCTGSDAHGTWLKRMDVLSAQLDAGYELRTDELTDIGAAGIHLVHAENTPWISVDAEVLPKET